MKPAALRWAAAGVVLTWLALHLAHANTLLVHDSWTHLFPFVFSVSRDVTCLGLPHWLSRVDTGSPHLIHVISSSLTHLVRLPALYATGCLQLDVLPALYLYKAQIYLSYLLFAGGMYALGRVLYREPASAVYLLAATLFTGLCLDSAHSDQVVSMMFWVPWVAICMVMYHRHRGSPAASWYLVGIVLFAAVQALDQYPHFIALAVLAAILVYAAALRAQLFAHARKDLRLIWVAALVAAIALFQLLSVKGEIEGYRPSLRAELTVDPAKFGETGFAQPPELIGIVFPLAMLEGHETLANGLGAWHAARGRGGIHGFMFRYDVLFFHLGIVAVFFFVLALFSAQARAARNGWLAFCLLMFLATLQQSKLYFLLHHLPFFNLFRSYGLYLCYFVFALLVVSGIGFDALLRADAAERRRLVRRASVVLLALAAAAAGGLAWLVRINPAPRQVLQAVSESLLIDCVLLGGALFALHWLSRRATKEFIAGSLTLLCLTQVVHAARVYFLLGTPVPEAVAQFGLQREDRVPAPATVKPEQYFRAECKIFTQCYLTQRSIASLRLDLEGSFLRSRDSVLYQPGINPAAVRALSGITHPVVWASNELKEYKSSPELVAILNRAGDRVGQALRETTYVRQGEVPGVGPGRSGSVAQLLRVENGQDLVRIGYASTAPFLLNVSSTYSGNWHAYAGGAQLAVRRGYFDNLLIEAPAGAREVELRYFSWRSVAFFASRYLMLILAVAAAVVLWRQRASGSGPAHHA